jgi:hypothetical protein
MLRYVSRYVCVLVRAFRRVQGTENETLAPQDPQQVSKHKYAATALLRSLENQQTITTKARSSNNSRSLVSLVLWCLVVGLFFISKAPLFGFCRGPLLEHRAPPVIAGRRGCQSSPTLLSPALPLVGTAAGGATCCVAEGHRRCDPPSERYRPFDIFDI